MAVVEGGWRESRGWMAVVEGGRGWWLRWREGGWLWWREDGVVEVDGCGFGEGGWLWWRKGGCGRGDVVVVEGGSCGGRWVAEWRMDGCHGVWLWWRVGDSRRSWWRWG